VPVKHQDCLVAHSDGPDHPLLDGDVGAAVASLDRFARAGLRFPVGRASASTRRFELRIRRDVRSQLPRC
jgi:hypothetical protein